MMKKFKSSMRKIDLKCLTRVGHSVRDQYTRITSLKAGEIWTPGGLTWENHEGLVVGKREEQQFCQEIGQGLK